MEKNTPTLAARAKAVATGLVISMVLAGACISLASMEMDPTKWPAVCRPIFVLVTFLFFQWLYRDAAEEKKGKEFMCFNEYKINRDKSTKDNNYKMMK
jgi:predicted tellurium resistance membrane protein TerC